jgi:hypothetical protein
MPLPCQATHGLTAPRVTTQRSSAGHSPRCLAPSPRSAGRRRHLAPPSTWPSSTGTKTRFLLREMPRESDSTTIRDRTGNRRARRSRSCRTPPGLQCYDCVCLGVQPRSHLADGNRPGHTGGCLAESLLSDQPTRSLNRSRVARTGPPVPLMPQIVTQSVGRSQQIAATTQQGRGGLDCPRGFRTREEAGPHFSGFQPLADAQ